MTTTEIFGFEQDKLDEARVAVESAFGIRLQEHDSSYLGEYYLATLPGGQQLQLRRNIDPLHQEGSDPSRERFTEPDFTDSALLLYVWGTELSGIRETLENHVTGISFLQQRVSV